MPFYICVEPSGFPLLRSIAIMLLFSTSIPHSVYVASISSTMESIFLFLLGLAPILVVANGDEVETLDVRPSLYWAPRSLQAIRANISQLPIWKAFHKLRRTKKGYIVGLM
jgi:hypothetical protein